jgi:hypothetical protein
LDEFPGDVQVDLVLGRKQGRQEQQKAGKREHRIFFHREITFFTFKIIIFYRRWHDRKFRYPENTREYLSFGVSCRFDFYNLISRGKLL